MEYDNGENFTDAGAEYISTTPTYHIVHDILLILFLIVAICANIAIIYVILRFKQMRSVETMFLLNWAIADMASQIITPTAYDIIFILDYISANRCLRCTLFHIGVNLQATTLYFVLLLTLDWYLATFFEKASKLFRKFYKLIVGAVWMISILTTSFTSGYCLADKYSFIPTRVLFYSFCALVILVVVLQLTRGVRKCLRRPIENSTLMLTLSTSFCISVLSAFVLAIVLHIGRMYYIALLIFAEILLFGCSIITLGLLYRFNTDFQSCLMQVLRRSPKYDDRICSFNNPIVRNMNKDSIQISFDNPKDELLNNVY